MKTEILPRTVDYPEIMKALDTRRKQEQHPYAG